MGTPVQRLGGLQRLWRQIGLFGGRAVVKADAAHTNMAQELRESVKEWANVDLRMTPAMPKRPPQYMDRYLDVSNPIFQPLLHTVSQGGSSNHRVHFTRALNVALGVEQKYVSHIVETGQCLHNCSLLVDDIADNTTTRRGVPAAHIKYGVASTMHAAYTALFNILMSIKVHLGESCLTAAIEEAARMHHCNAMEIYMRDTYTPSTETQYLDMIDGKTGSGFRIITRFLLTLAPTSIGDDVVSRCLLDATTHIGRFFQIRDDYMDLVSEEFAKKKGGYGSDFYEGKFTFPVIHCIRTRPETLTTFLEVFKRPATDVTPKDVERLTNLLRESGSLQYTLDALQREASTVRQLLRRVAEKGRNTLPLGAWFLNLARTTPNFEVSTEYAQEVKFLDEYVKRHPELVAATNVSPSTATAARTPTSPSSPSPHPAAPTPANPSTTPAPAASPSPSPLPPTPSSTSASLFIEESWPPRVAPILASH